MESKLDLNSIIRLELRNKHGHKLNDKKLTSISRILTIDFEQLKMLNMSCKRIWFIPDGTRMELICAVYESSSVYEIPPIFFSKFERLSSEFLKAILTMEPINVFEVDKEEVFDMDFNQVQMPKPKIKSPKKEVFNVDDILDKINETGMDSLSSSELEFLKSLSK
jgi:hypothetical protein